MRAARWRNTMPSPHCRLQRYTRMRVALYKRMHPKTRCLPSRRGRIESASGISLGSTDAPTTARSWTSKMESNIPRDESGWIDGNADHAKVKGERERQRQVEPGHSQTDISIHNASSHGCVVSGLRTHRFWVLHAHRNVIREQYSLIGSYCSS